MRPLYALTLKGETTTYTLLSRGDPVTCILYKGDLGSADLRASAPWQDRRP
jgi:hypothetical protein